MINKLHLPYQKNVPELCTDALQDLHIRLGDFVNFVGEVLITREYSKDKINGTHNFKPELTTRVLQLKIEVPEIEINSEKWNNLIKELPEQLFFSSVMRLATIYESYLHEIFREILWRQFDLLLSDDKQLSTKEIFDHEDLKDIQETLIEKKIHNLLMQAYPLLAKSCSKLFKTEFHGNKSPMDLFEIHDFLEIRNVIAHNDGYAPDMYFERLEEYDKTPFIPRTGAVPINFKWLFQKVEKFKAMCTFLDQELTKKWKTSKADYENA